MFGRGICEKNTSLETKFPSPFGSGNFSSLDCYFSQIPLPNMIYLYKILLLGYKHLRIYALTYLLYYEKKVYKK